MRIAIVSDYGTVNGGAARVALIGARALAERGHEVHFVCATEPVGPALRHPNIRLHYLGESDVWTERNPLRAAARGIWNRAPARHVRDLLARFDPRELDRPLSPMDEGAEPERDRRRCRLGSADRVHPA